MCIKISVCIYIYIYIFIYTYTLFLSKDLEAGMYTHICMFIYMCLLFEGASCSNYPSSLPICALCGVAKRGFGLGTSRRSRRSNGMLLEVYTVPPRPFRIWSVFGSKSISRSGEAHRCFPDLGFSRLDRPLAHPNPKVCIIITLFVCTLRKRL